jgi:hypothetical protein
MLDQRVGCGHTNKPSQNAKKNPSRNYVVTLYIDAWNLGTYEYK